MKPTLFLLTLSVLTLLSCVHRNPVQTNFVPAYPERNSVGDPIVAVFEGRIPCAVEGCEKRKVELVLYGRDEGRVPTTYWLGQLRVGMGNDRLVQQAPRCAGVPERVGLRTGFARRPEPAVSMARQQ
jgi:hypothetical protein